MSKLYFKYGVMNSAKSATLLTQEYALRTSGFPVLTLKSSIDTRDKDEIKSRVKGLSAKCLTISPSDEIIPIFKSHFKDVLNDDSKKPQWILIDECQFLTEAQVDELRTIVNNNNTVNVMCYGLRTDFMTHFFPGSKRLMEIADSIEEIKLSCPFCGKKATVNARIDAQGNVIVGGEQIHIGGNESYVAMCSKCYHDRIPKDDKK